MSAADVSELVELVLELELELTVVVAVAESDAVVADSVVADSAVADSVVAASVVAASVEVSATVVVQDGSAELAASAHSVAVQMVAAQAASPLRMKQATRMAQPRITVWILILGTVELTDK